MSKRSALLIIGLLAAIAVVATVIDLLGLGGNLPGLRSSFAPRPDQQRELFGPPFTRGEIPRAVRSLASIAALAGYGVLLRYLAPGRLATIARALSRAPAGLARHGLNGLALLILIAALILLATISVITAPLAPLLGAGLGIAGLTGLTACALILGRRLRAWAAAPEDNPIADLLAGLALLFLITQIPYVGPLALLVAALIGLGAIAATRFGEAEQWLAEPLEY